MTFMPHVRLFILIALIGGTIASCSLTNSNVRGKAVDLQPETNAQISFDTIKSLIIIEAEINGHKGRFLFDNGFTLSAIHPDFAEKAGITFNKSASASDINRKKITLKETSVASLKIGDFDFQETGFYKIDTKKFFPCESIDGVIGGSVINKVNWKILYRDRTIEISKKPFPLPADGGTVIDVIFTRGNSAIATLTFQETDINCKIDIGMSGEVSIKKEFSSSFVGKKATYNVGISSLGATGLGNIEGNYQLANRMDISFGNAKLPVGGDIELDESQRYNGYVGVGYLKHYDFIVNSTKKEYVLINPIAPKAKKNESYGINLYLVDDTCRIIQKNGWDELLTDVPVMSAIIEIDSIPASDFSDICALRAYLKQKRIDKSDMVLRIKDSEEPLILPYREDKIILIEENL
jgi:hypothetical protein